MLIKKIMDHAAKQPSIFNEIHLALGKEFKPNNPYSRIMVMKLTLGGPITETHWIKDDSTNSNTMIEKVKSNLTHHEQLEIVGKFHHNAYLKGINFKSNKIKAHAISHEIMRQQ